MKHDNGVIAFPVPQPSVPTVADLRSLSTWLSRILAPLAPTPGAPDLVIVREPGDEAPGGPIPEGHVWIGGPGHHEIVAAAGALALLKTCYTAHVTAYEWTADDDDRRMLCRRARAAIEDLFGLLEHKRLSTVLRIVRGSQFTDGPLSVNIDGERFTVVGFGVNKSC